MIWPIMKDIIFLAQKSVPAVNCEEDLQVARDLLETLEAHKEGCVGMAANMIGVSKRIIAFDNEGTYMVMFNPEIVKSSDRYEAEEGCLSLTGIRKTKRWKSIKVQYQNEQFQTRFKTFTGWTAQIIQHEIDHCNGIII
ncbi:peptide deformylase (plasmid) [Pusillibacter faecalis]|uniref:Peptide deformylase n=1 Tax=Pusillibacter faecalis TaxID=2714358 RepID=A0A830QX13_9FIRM|nr:peptide deformylase [Pusillibacter faecalis]BCK85897.1 peptide deformylase [Pusillibacter faecalis]